MAKFDLSKTFENADGTPAVAADTKQALDLRWALTQICLHEVSGNGEPVRAQAKVRRYDLYRRIKKAGCAAVELSPEDVTFMREAALVFPTLLAGQTREMLEEPIPPEPKYSDAEAGLA